MTRESSNYPLERTEKVAYVNYFLHCKMSPDIDERPVSFDNICLAYNILLFFTKL